MWSTGPTEHKHPEANFRLFLLFVAETSQVRLSWMRVVMADTDVLESEVMVVGEPGAGTQTVAQAGDDRVAQPNLPMELDSLARCLSSLQDLMMLLPSSASEVT